MIKELWVFVVFLFDLSINCKVIKVVIKASWCPILVLMIVSVWLVSRRHLALADVKGKRPLLCAWVLGWRHCKLQTTVLLLELLKRQYLLLWVRRLEGTSTQEVSQLLVFSCFLGDSDVFGYFLPVIASSSLLLVASAQLWDDQAAEALSFLGYSKQS